MLCFVKQRDISCCFFNLQGSLQSDGTVWLKNKEMCNQEVTVWEFCNIFSVFSNLRIIWATWQVDISNSIKQQTAKYMMRNDASVRFPWKHCVVCVETSVAPRSRPKSCSVSRFFCQKKLWLVLFLYAIWSRIWERCKEIKSNVREFLMFSFLLFLYLHVCFVSSPDMFTHQQTAFDELLIRHIC